MLTSSEEFLASQSQGMDITVDSDDIMQYDHVEEIKKKKWLYHSIFTKSGNPSSSSSVC